MKKKTPKHQQKKEKSTKESSQSRLTHSVQSKWQQIKNLQKKVSKKWSKILQGIKSAPSLQSFYQKKELFKKRTLHIIPGVFLSIWDAIVILVGIAITLLVLLFIWKLHEPLLLKPLGMYDEGVTLLGAKRFANGEIPYRDFFTIYGPLKFSILGGFFFLMNTLHVNPGVYEARLFFATISIAGFLITFLFYRRESNIIYATVFTLFLALFGKFSLTPFFLILIALWFANLIDNPKSHFLPLLGGVLIGLLFLLRIDFGGFTSLSIFILLTIFVFFSKRCSGSMYASIIGKLLLGFLFITTPVFIALGSIGALGQFWMQAVEFPMFGTYQGLRHLPWYEFSQLKEPIQGYLVNFKELSHNFAWFFWPIPFVISGGYWIYRGIKKNPFPLEGFLKNILLALFTIAAFLYASHRSDYGHVSFLNLLAAIFFFHLILQFQQRGWGLLFIPIFFLLTLYPAQQLLHIRNSILENKSTYTQYSFFSQPIAPTQKNEDLQKVIDYFSTVPIQEKVYVGVKDTSRVFVNNVMLPFLLNQPVATKYHELHTGIVTTLPVQLEMIDELKDVNYVVLWEFFICEKNNGCISTGIRKIDDYITSHFEKKASYGEYEILKRKPLNAKK